MKPTLGRIVHYTLSERDAAAINRRRRDAYRSLNQHRLDEAKSYPPLARNGTGEVYHIGSTVQAGDVCAAVITQVGEKKVDLKVLLNGNDDLWVRFVEEGNDHEQWFWPPREG